MTPELLLIGGALWSSWALVISIQVQQWRGERRERDERRSQPIPRALALPDVEHLARRRRPRRLTD